MATATRVEILSLFRSLLRTSLEFSDYNIREYAKRRAADGFRQNRSLSDPSALAAAYSDAKLQLEIAKRQVLVYQLYSPKIKSVMDVKL